MALVSLGMTTRRLSDSFKSGLSRFEEFDLWAWTPGDPLPAMHHVAEQDADITAPGPNHLAIDRVQVEEIGRWILYRRHPRALSRYVAVGERGHCRGAAEGSLLLLATRVWREADAQKVPWREIYRSVPRGCQCESMCSDLEGRQCHRRIL